MRPLAAVERFFERLFERPSARLFHAPLQPIQVQRRLEREMDAGRVDTGDRAYVPDRYTVTLHPRDAEAFDGVQARVENDLADALHARARARGYRLIARPTVRLRTSGDVPRGDIRVAAEALDRRQLKRINGNDDRLRGTAGTNLPAPPRSASPAPRMYVAPVVPGRVVGSGPAIAIAAVGRLPSEDRALRLQPRIDRVTLVPPDVALGTPVTPPTGAYLLVGSVTPSSGSPTTAPDVVKRTIATLELRTGGRLISTRAFDGGTLRVGRGRDNELVFADDRVSRHHGQLTARRGVLVYADLGSTNGSFVNGTRVHEIVLGSGDVVRLGNSTLTIQSQS